MTAPLRLPDDLPGFLHGKARGGGGSVAMGWGAFAIAWWRATGAEPGDALELYRRAAYLISAQLDARRAPHMVWENAPMAALLHHAADARELMEMAMATAALQPSMVARGFTFGDTHLW